jgi:hypothetical protein
VSEESVAEWSADVPQPAAANVRTMSALGSDRRMVPARRLSAAAVIVTAQ